MKNILIGILLLCSFTFVNAQTPYFNVTVNSCCATITVNTLSSPEWIITIEGTNYSNTSHPSGMFVHCFSSNGIYWASFNNPSVGSPVLVPITITSCCNPPVNGCAYLFIEDCCVELFVINDPACPRDWRIDFGNGQILTRSQNNGDDVVRYCYDELGMYGLSLTYEGGGGSSTVIEITSLCEKCYLSRQCWHEVANAWGEDCGTHRCFYGVRLQLPDGSIVDVNFAPIVVSEGWLELYLSIINAINSQGYSANFFATDPTGELSCNKGNDFVPGYFIYSKVRVLNVLSDFCPGEPTGNCSPGSGPGVNFDVEPTDLSNCD